MLEVIKNAKDGNRFFEARVFDGSEDGDKSLLTTTVVGKQQDPQKDDADAAKAGEFSKTAFLACDHCLFQREQPRAIRRPSTACRSSSIENGITRDLTMDYGDFVLAEA